MRTLLALATLIAFSVVIAGPAMAAPTPDAGGSRSVNEDSAEWYNGTDGSGEGLAFGWIFDGAVVDGQDVQFTFGTPGSYSVSFWADDLASNNVSDTITVTVTDITPPSANAGADQSVNEDTVVNFDASNSSDNDPGFSSTGNWTWTFSDAGAQTLYGNTATYTFATPGTYVVTLTVKDAALNSATDTLVVTVKDVTAPAANAGADQAADEDTSFTFDASGSMDNDPNFATTGRYYWTFSDNGVLRSLTGQSASYTFNTPGAYTISLLVLDAAGNFGYDVMIVTARDTTPPTAVIVGGATQTFNEDAPKSMDATGSADNDPNFATTGRFYWTFMDGTAKNVSGKTVSYTFATPGTFAITLTVMDNRGNVATATSTFTVSDVTNPVPVWTLTSPFNEDAIQTLNGASSTDNVGVTSYSWAITDTSGTTTLTGASVTYTWATPGSYSVTLTVQDAAGNSASLARVLAVKDITPPSGGGSVPATWAEDSAVTFNSASITDNDPSFTSPTYPPGRRDYWTFTDGVLRNVSGSGATYTFATPGTFVISLLTMDAAGNRLTASFTIVITDVTPPAPVISLASQNQNREQFFGPIPFSGTTSDNVAVIASWWLFNNGTAQNMSGLSITGIRFNTAGTYLITFQSRDAAFNIGSAFTNITVFPDATPPTVSFVAPPLTGDDATPVTYNATAVDNDPSCAASCVWTWSMDGVASGSTALTFTTQWTTPGQHLLTLAVRDPTGNTRFVNLTVNIDQMVSSDLLWSGVNRPLDWNIRVTNGATFTIRNSQIWNATTGINATINVTSGRLLVEGSTFVSNVSNLTFRFYATGVGGAGSYLYFNDSTVSGLTDWITVWSATVSARNTTFTTTRVANIGLIRGVDSNIYLTQVTLSSVTQASGRGVLANYTAAIGVFDTREVILQRVTATSIPQQPFEVSAIGVQGVLNVTIRDSTFKSTNPSNATVRGLFFYIGAGTNGHVNTRIVNTSATGNLYGGLYAIASGTTAFIDWNITDSNFGNSGAVVPAVTADGMLFWTRASTLGTPQESWYFMNVTSWRNTGSGLSFNNTFLGAMRGSVWLEQVWLNNNTQDGIYSRLADSLTNWTWTVRDVDVSFNRNGIYLDWNRSWGSRLTVTMDRTRVDNNAQSGLNFVSINEVVNMTFEVSDSSFSRNAVAGMFIMEDHGTAANANRAGRMYNDFVLNLTRVMVKTNTYGIWAYDRNGNQNLSGRWTNTTVSENYLDGCFFDSYLTSYSYLGLNWVDRNITLTLVDSEISRNNRFGFYTYDFLSGMYASPQVSSSQMVQLRLINSHVDRNLVRGIYWQEGPGQYSYAIYSASQFRLWLNESTVDNNGGSGIWFFLNSLSYAWTLGMVGRGKAEASIWAVNSSISRNGLTQPDGDAIHIESYYLYGPEIIQIEMRNTTLSGNGGNGIRTFHNYIYYAGSLRLWVVDSRISDNLGKGVSTYVFYAYTLSGVLEHIENTTLSNNVGEPILHEYPDSYGRYGTPWTVEYINNTIDRSNLTAISTAVSYVCTNCPAYGGPEVFNFSGNRITNITGAAIAWSFTGPLAGQLVRVDFSDNYIADTQDGANIAVAGSASTTHVWNVNRNLFERNAGAALLLAMSNTGSGNQGTLTFNNNVFRNTGGTAFTLIQSSIKMSSLLIKDCVFDTQRIGIELSGIVGSIDNATFVGSVKSDVSLENGLMEIHNTPVNPDKLKTVGTAAAFNIFFDLKVYVEWAGTGKSVNGAVAEYADSTGNIFFVGTVADSSGLPSLELWSYTKSAQGVLGRTPFTIHVTYFEIAQSESIDLYQDRVVTIQVTDNVRPTLVITSPLDGYGTQEDTIQLDGTAYDSQSGFSFDLFDPQLPAQFVEVSSDNVSWALVRVISSSAYDVQFEYTFTGLGESVRALYVRVHDVANNYWTRVIPVQIDRTPPVVTILSPATSSVVTNAALFHLSAETEVGTEIFVNGLVPPEVFTRPDLIHVYFEMDLPIFEGPNTVTVVAIDPLNNQGNASIFVLVDRQPPYLAVITPEVDALVNSTTVSVVGQTERSGVTVTVNGAPAAIDANGNISATLSLTSDFNRIEILATDLAGNTQLVVREVRFDNVPPWINVQSPPSNALVNSPDVDVIGIVEPGAKLIVNDEVVNAPTGAFTRRILLTEGVNTIQFVAIDPAGNYGYRTVFVTVDTLRPVIDITAPANESLVNRTNVVVTGTVSDAHSPEVLVNGQEVAVNTDGSFQAAIALYEGTNFIEVESRDGAGNSNLQVLTVIRDTQVPFLVSGLEGVFFEGTALKTFNRSVTVVGFTERGAVVDVCYTNAAGTKVCNPIPLAADGGFRTFVELRAEQSNTMTVTATDAAGNSITRSFQVIQAAPIAAAVEPPNYGLYALYGLGAAILVGSFFVLYMRKGKGGREVELAEAEGGYMAGAPTLTMDQPPQADAVYGSPEYSVPSGYEGEVASPATAAPEPMQAPEGGLQSQASTPPLEDVPAAPSRVRPVRRRPVPGAAGESASTLTGMGAEQEAVPGESHQSEPKEG